MNINCPNCNKEYEIDDSKIPPGGAKVKCSDCETMIDIDFPEDTPDWYVTTDNENVYEASTEEVIEWIAENRLLREHQVSKDGNNWSKIDAIVRFEKVFAEKEAKIAEQEAQKEALKQKELEKTLEEEPAPSYKQIDYTDYDDSIIEDSSAYKPKKNHFIVWLSLLILLGAGIFAIAKPKLIKELFTKINSKNNVKSEDNYNRAMMLSKKYDINTRDEVLSLFNKSLKDNPKYEPALIGKGEFIVNIIFIETLNMQFREKLAKKLETLSKKENNETINKLLLSNNKEMLLAKKNIKYLNTLLTIEFKSSLENLAIKNNYEASIIMGMISYLNNEKEELKKHFATAKRLKINDLKTELLKFLYLKKYKDKTFAALLEESITDNSSSIMLNFLNAFELLNQSKTVEAKYMFMAVKGISKTNQTANNYLELLNKLIKNKELLEPKKETDQASDKKTDENKEAKQETKQDEVKKGEGKAETKKEVKKEAKPVKKVVKQLSPRRASEMGWDLIDANRLSASIKKFKYAISKDPSLAEAYQGLGEVYRLRGDKAKALKYFRIFLAKDPNNSEASLVRRQIKKLESE